MPELSIIVINNSSWNYLRQCLSTIFSQKFNDYEVILINNGAPDNSLSSLRDVPINLMIIENNINLGASKARNQGIEASRGKYILFLDSDTRLEEGFLSVMLSDIRADISLAAVQPLVLRDDKRTVDSTGIHLSWLRRFYDIGSGDKEISKYDKKRYVFGACTAAAIYRGEALETIKQGDEYFDEDFFYLVEDVDLSWRLQKRGWRTLYTPDAVCLHSGGRSRNKDKISQYLALRNRYLMMIKNETFVGVLRYLLVFLIYDSWRNVFMLFTNTVLFFKAIGEVFKLYPQKRRERII